LGLVRAAAAAFALWRGPWAARRAFTLDVAARGFAVFPARVVPVAGLVARLARFFAGLAGFFEGDLFVAAAPLLALGLAGFFADFLEEALVGFAAARPAAALDLAFAFAMTLTSASSGSGRGSRGRRLTSVGNVSARRLAWATIIRTDTCENRSPREPTGERGGTPLSRLPPSRSRATLSSRR
jgi:hypothetical protein